MTTSVQSSVVQWFRILVLALLASWRLHSVADQYNATIVVTNNPSHGHTLTVISGSTTNTRTWVTNVTSAATQIAISNSVAASATNLWLQTAANPWTATTYSYQTANGIVLFQHGTVLSASLLTNWGTITITTNTTSTEYTLRLPITAEPNAQHRTNQANRVVALLNDYATDDLDAGVLGLSAYITNNQPNSITSAMIADGAVTNADLAADAVTSAKIADGTVTNADLAASAVTAAKIAAAAVTNSHLAADAVTSDKIADGTVTNADLAADAVTSAKIADGTVTNADLAASAVTATKIAAAAVTNSHIAANAVTSNKIDWSTITVPMGSLASFILTNNQTSVTLDGTFSGDGSGLTGLQADSTNAVFTVMGPGDDGTNSTTRELIFEGDGVSQVTSNGTATTVTITGGSGGRTILSNITLAANVASIVFTNIAASYSHLEMELFLHNSDAADSRRVNVRFNGSTNAYDFQQISAVSTTVAGEIVQDAQQGELGFAAANNNAVYRFSPIHVEIPFYAGAGEKLYSSENAEKSGSGSTQFALRRYVGWWSQTNAITWIELLPASGNFTTNSRAILYGVD